MTSQARMVIVEIITALLLVALVAGAKIEEPIAMAQENTPVVSPSPSQSPTVITKVEVTITKKTPKPKVLTVEGKVQETFGEDNIMNKVAFCESSFNPEAKSNSSTATGLFQIIIGTWNHYKCTGDRTNADDNIKCAKKIYDKRGTQDWNASKHCWGVN